MGGQTPTDYLIVACKSGKTYDIITFEPLGLQQSFSTQNNPLNESRDWKKSPDTSAQPVGKKISKYSTN